MDLIWGPIKYSKCVIHLDDVVALGGTWKDQISNLAAVFDRLRSAGLKLKPSKCQFFRQKVLYLGYVISEKGIGPDPSKVEAITKWQPPMDVKGVKAFLGTAGCYRSFIKDYSDKAAPLNQLLRGGVKFEWTGDHQRAFDILKNALISEPILSYTTRKEDCPDCKQLRGKPLPGTKLRKVETRRDESDGDERDSVFGYCVDQIQVLKAETATECLETDFLCASVSPPVAL